MPSHLLDYQTVAEDIIEKTITELLRYRTRLPIVPFWTKSDGSFVTPADYGVQFCLQKKLCLAFPHIPFIGEEILDPTHDQHKCSKILEFIHALDPEVTDQDLLETPLTEQDPSSLYWLVDPIDGTAGFIKNRFFAIALSLIHNNQPILAVMACPSPDLHTFKIYSAAKNYGASLFGSAIQGRRCLEAGKTMTGKFCEASLAARNQQHHSTRLLSLSLPGQPQAYRVDSQYKYAMVAEGIVDFFIRYPFAISHTRAWDHIPGAFLVEEAGGVVTDIFGHALNSRKDNFTLENHPVILASGNAQIHSTTLEKLQKQYTHFHQENSLISKHMY
ncbi:hypothetical protein BOKEGFJH_00602 [Chlamydia avium]|nr:inositol monophosphatase family protein [Chlamydia avium]EPP37011.1 inositol monophosphatase family protein [Chlamydia psittaci 10_743_SC13]EPP38542.1 inositol monophosphatase family protein [Chlamydia avium]VVT43072.1 hypothetical protein BOKEGFJH_00602 [Chlamydia avium]